MVRARITTSNEVLGTPQIAWDPAPDLHTVARMKPTLSGLLAQALTEDRLRTARHRQSSRAVRQDKPFARRFRRPVPATGDRPPDDHPPATPGLEG